MILHVVDGDVAAWSSRVAGRDRLDTPLRPHAAAHRPARAVGRVRHAAARRAPRAFISAPTYATIDLAREVTAAEIARAEDDANRVVWEDRPVAIRFVDAAEAAALPLRKASAREGTLRLIDVDGYDLSACGGTHVARTGAIGIIAVTGWERFKGGTRVGFVCGGRALRAHRRLRDVVGDERRGCCRSRCGRAAGRASSASRRTRRRPKRPIKDLQGRLARHEADRPRRPPQWTASSSRHWMAGIRTALKTIAVGHRRTSRACRRARRRPRPFGCRRRPRTRSLPTDCAAVLKQLAARFGGKGGGRPELAQGGGLQGDVREAIAAYLRCAALKLHQRDGRLRAPRPRSGRPPPS